mmetsp:Transcript_1654/g.5306  ORF Transcript_1654/g.5306 Transcript_1654/m.5306 type:complete len:231 (+) Transcript_1654:1144-1836(+)
MILVQDPRLALLVVHVQVQVRAGTQGGRRRPQQNHGAVLGNVPDGRRKGKGELVQRLACRRHKGRDGSSRPRSDWFHLLVSAASPGQGKDDKEENEKGDAASSHRCCNAQRRPLAPTLAGRLVRVNLASFVLRVVRRHLQKDGFERRERKLHISNVQFLPSFLQDAKEGGKLGRRVLGRRGKPNQVVATCLFQRPPLRRNQLLNDGRVLGDNCHLVPGPILGLQAQRSAE